MIICYQGFGKGTDGPSVDRRLKKTGDFILGQTLAEIGRGLLKQSSSSCLAQVFIHSFIHFFIHPFIHPSLYYSLILSFISTFHYPYTVINSELKRKKSKNVFQI